MGNFTGGEFIIILIVALVVLGPERLPEMARSAGKMIHKLKTMADGMGADVKGVMDDPSMQPLKELGELAARPRQKLAEYALEAEAEERARKEAAAQVAADAADAAADAAETARPPQPMQPRRQARPLVRAMRTAHPMQTRAQRHRPMEQG